MFVCFFCGNKSNLALKTGCEKHSYHHDCALKWKQLVPGWNCLICSYLTSIEKTKECPSCEGCLLTETHLQSHAIVKCVVCQSQFIKQAKETHLSFNCETWEDICPSFDCKEMVPILLIQEALKNEEGGKILFSHHQCKYLSFCSDCHKRFISCHSLKQHWIEKRCVPLKHPRRLTRESYKNED